MACTDGIFSQDQRAVDGVPDGERPISNELGKAVGTPLFVRRRNDDNVCRSDGQGISQLLYKVCAIV